MRDQIKRALLRATHQNEDLGVVPPALEKEAEHLDECLKRASKNESVMNHDVGLLVYLWEREGGPKAWERDKAEAKKEAERAAAKAAAEAEKGKQLVGA